jgi:GTPase SAR1 family protein
MRVINEYLSPVDTHICKIAKESVLPKMKQGLLVVGVKGHGKTTIVSALLGCKFQEKYTRPSTKSLSIRH